MEQLLYVGQIDLLTMWCCVSVGLGGRVAAAGFS